MSNVEKNLNQVRALGAIPGGCQAARLSFTTTTDAHNGQVRISVVVLRCVPCTMRGIYSSAVYSTIVLVSSMSRLPSMRPRILYMVAEGEIRTQNK